jgi:hypothetical protein
MTAHKSKEDYDPVGDVLRDAKAVPDLGARSQSHQDRGSMKSCKCCGDLEWLCFLINKECRMCQARRRDARRREKL